ncbi:DNA translocase FtsK [Virgibacillus doumboii]|uniref:DNA translocase FtsK n=1 Tax=Virgibacillus doumboii TaxID=2697503 RepID=UPI0013DEE659|nr:DNA translocase FtsK [Virgibacillus doumboii]
MLDRWKKKLNNFFFTEIDEKDDKPARKIDHKTQDVRTKMMYQYPDNKSFRFPVIPDLPKKQDDTWEVPAFERKRKRNESNSKQVEKSPHNHLQNRKVTKPESGKPFVPTEVPSPIYGFQQRKKEKEVENIPAYKRKETIRYDDFVKEDEPLPEEATYTDKNEQTDNEPPKPVERDVKKLNRAESRSNKRVNRKRSNHKQKHQDGPKPPPFNVMMSANDKRRQAIKQGNSRKPFPEKKEVSNKTIPYHLLNDPVQKSIQDKLWMKNQKELLEKTLKHFNVSATVVNTAQGPTVTRFEVQPALGVKVSKVKNLSDDLKLNMAAKDIRIEAPIPGKNTIGIEIPNPEAQMVGLQEIFETNDFQKSASPLTIGLGLNIEGSPMITNIQKMPHGLIAGATGSGKSVCINTILISMLYKANHEDVKFLLIDPKMVELAPYNGIPHLISPVITDVKAATMALKWAVNEMEERYDKFVHEGVRDIERYNQKMSKQNRPDDKMPFIIIVIDELADLMMVSPQDVEDAISRIAQKARACGIHLLLATQRPSVDVITGLIKANIPTRIAFSVSSQVDSRTIMDTSGAEKLLGKGDMLFIGNGSGKSVRLQGAFVSDEEIERVTDYARQIAQPNYAFEQEHLLEQIETDEQEDDLLKEAIEFVVNQNSASTSLLQRHFKIGYNRAARLMDAMENKGIISGQNGSKPRDILASRSQLEV